MIAGRSLPFTLPSSYVTLPGNTSAGDVDDGGYDFKLGGFGFRLATDQQNPYQRGSEPTTVRRFDDSSEPGEQTLSPLPWVKSQASFHGGAGQLNLESGLTSFQYEQEHVSHVRFDSCQGVDVWTPGEVSRLPDTRLFSLGFSASCMVTGTSGGVDYAVLGGNGGLYQLAWTAGPDADPTITAIDLSGSTYGGSSNCNVTSLATDGANYYAVIQLTSVGYVPTILTYIARGQMSSASSPVAIYEVPGSSSGVNRTNLCTNPSFETGTTGWSASGSTPPTIATSSTVAKSGSQSLKVTGAGSASFTNNAQFTVSGLTVGVAYTCSIYVYLPSGSITGSVGCGINGVFGTSTSVTNSWTRLQVTHTATATSHSFFVYSNTYTSGQFFYADACLIEQATTPGSYFDGSTTAAGGYTYAWTGTANASTSTATFTASVVQTPGIVGWQKARLIGCLGQSLYELSGNAAAHTALPSPKYTYPSSGWTWSCISESPTAVLAAGTTGQQSAILEFVLDTSGAVPTLSGGATVAVLPTGESITSLGVMLGSFLGIGTTEGIRVGTFDTYTGKLTYGPITLKTTSPVMSMTGRDRFLYGGWSNGQPDGKTGLFRVDMSYTVDTAGRLAYAPDLRPPSTSPTGLGDVACLGILPSSGRLVFTATDGIFVEGGSPGSDEGASCWIKTSRIRYDTAENKLFKSGKITGTLDSTSVTVTGIAPFGSSTNLGTFGFITNSNPPEFGLPTGTHEWIQLQLHLNGAGCIVHSYQVKAYPAPSRQHVITLTAICFAEESDRYGLAVVDPQTPRQRWQNLSDLEQAGDEVRFVEFTNQGPTVDRVLIDQLAYISNDRPSIDNDFGGYITMKLRVIE